jgi:hypothetical protein
MEKLLKGIFRKSGQLSIFLQVSQRTEGHHFWLDNMIF